jgi:hypothetical protein
MGCSSYKKSPILPQNVARSILVPWNNGTLQAGLCEWSGLASAAAGIGLRVVHQIALKHAGWVRTDNNATGGATFQLVLPSR